MQRIVYYFPEKDTYMYKWQRVHIIDEMAHYGFKFDTFNPLKYPAIEDSYEDLISFVKKNPPVLFLACICSKRHLGIDVLEEIKRLGVPTLSFRPDNLAIPYNDRELGRHFDLLWLTDKQTKGLYDKWGIKNYVAPYAANPFFFKRENLPLVDRACFIGTVHGSRAKMINRIAQEKEIEIDIYDKKSIRPTCDNENKVVLPTRGRLHEAADKMKFSVGRKLLLSAFLNRHICKQTELENKDNIHHLSSVPFEEVSTVYSSYRVSLSSTSYHDTDVLRHPVSVVNLRGFEIPMCGGLQFCRWNDELAEYFEDGKEIVMYRDDEEMMDILSYYLFRASEREIVEMKAAARARAEKDHIWLKRFEPAFREFGIKY
jgi:hypothetical protein